MPVELNDDESAVVLASLRTQYEALASNLRGQTEGSAPWHALDDALTRITDLMNRLNHLGVKPNPSSRSEKRRE